MAWDSITRARPEQRSGLEEARRRIEIAAREQATELDLGGLGLTEIPEELYELSHLRVLYLGTPKEIAEKPYWTRTLADKRNAVRALPPALFISLPHLTHLHLDHNGLTGLPSEIALLTGLTSLDLEANGIGADGARSLSSLTGLTSLDLGGNRIGDDGARSLSSLTGLTFLNLSDNGIGADGARSLSSLSGLTSLYLGYNKISEAGLSAVLEAWASRPHRLETLHFGNIPLKRLRIPAETLNSGDAQAILAAYRAHTHAAKAGKLVRLNEAKLLVVGSEDVGKTSLIRYLVHNKPRDPDEKTTPGAKIHERIEIHGWSPSATDIKLNVWDFGGQEIMHGTHRYFLTQRSLYLLVLEDRREDNCPIHDWLKMIANRGGDSPVIVVINKSDQGKEALSLDREQLSRDYPNIIGFYRTSCDADPWAADSVKALREAIARAVDSHDGLKEIRDEVPESWLAVKNRISDRAREAHVLRLSDFEALCLKAAEDSGNGDDELKTEAGQRALLRLLHDLGALVAHGLAPDDRAVRRDVMLLDPNWLTGGVYAILTAPVLRQQNGVFHRSDLQNWLDLSRYPVERHEFILEMMQDKEVGLCFELPGERGERFLAPEALPPNTPDYDSFWRQDTLRFRFTYDYLPKGLLPRFIVEAHRKLTAKQTLWSSGAMFEAAGCQVLVSGDRSRRVVDIGVSGPAAMRRSALNTVLNDLERVHRMNPEIGEKARVPLPDQPELDESYEHLLVLEEEDGAGYEYRPSGARRKYAVHELLEGVRLDPRWDDDMGPRGGRRPRPDPRPAPDPAPPPAPARPLSWMTVSALTAAGAMALYLALTFTPDAWRLWAGGLVSTGLVGFVFMIFHDPDLIYRRLAVAVTATVLLANVAGKTIELFVNGQGAQGFFRWGGDVGTSFNVFGFGAVAVFAAADLYLNRKR